MKTKTRKTPSVGLTLLKSSCVKRQVSGYESSALTLSKLLSLGKLRASSRLLLLNRELSSHTPASCHTTDVAQARRRKNPASLKNHFSQYIAVMSGCAAGFLGFSLMRKESLKGITVFGGRLLGACTQAELQQMALIR